MAWLRTLGGKALLVAFRNYSSSSPRHIRPTLRVMLAAPDTLAAAATGMGVRVSGKAFSRLLAVREAAERLLCVSMKRRNRYGVRNGDQNSAGATSESEAKVVAGTAGRVSTENVAPKSPPRRSAWVELYSFEPTLR